MIILLVRHGQSTSNTREIDATHVGDHTIPLTETGRRQLQLTGQRIITLYPEFFTKGILSYRSPFLRTRQSHTELIRGAESVKYPLCPGFTPMAYEDPRLREVEWGYDKPEDHGDYVDEMRGKHGKFYYRMDGGESPADCFDRISTFLETLMRQVKRKDAKRVLIVAHGLTIRCFVMRFMHLTVEQFDQIRNPKNGDIITITNEHHMIESEFTLEHAKQKPCHLIKPQFSCGDWRIGGLRLPHNPQDRAYPWTCPICKAEKVWPYPESDKCSQCENCGEEPFSA